MLPKLILTKKLEALKDFVKPDLIEQNSIKPCQLLSHNWQLEENIYCHGDLSLENILIYNNDFYLIDYLDSFCNSWMLDISKILMDLESGWSIRHLEKFSYINSMIKFQHIKTKLTEEMIKNGITLPQYKECTLLSILHMYRNLPYVKNESDEKFIYSAIQTLSQKYKVAETNYEHTNRTMRR